MKRINRPIGLFGLALIFIVGCITITRVPREADVGSHHVTVLPNCEHAATHSERQFENDGSSKILYYEFTCGQTKMRIEGNVLTVNGKSYGSLNEGDTIALNDGEVRVNSTSRAANNR